MHNDLYTYLLTELGLSAVFADRIYHMSMPQSVNTYPALTFQQIARTPEWPDFGDPDGPKIDTVLYQFDVIATSSSGVIAAAETFDTIFRNFRGTMGATKVQSVVLNSSTHLEERNGDKLRRRVTMDYSITFNV